MTIPFLLVFAALGASDETREIRKTLPLSAQGRVAIDTYKGLIQVSVWDQAQVELTVRIEPDGWGSSDRELVRDTNIEIDSRADTLRLKTHYPKGRMSWLGTYSNPIVKYILRMPRTARLEIKDYKSDIQIDGLAAALDIDTYKGEVRVNRQDGGAVHVKTYKSEARVEFTHITDRMSFESYRGSYDILVPREARFDIDSNLGRRGSLRTSFATVRPASSAGGYSRVNGGGPILSLKGYRPTVHLR
jgi:hypothetical protein